MYLSSFAHEVGERVPIADLADETLRAGLDLLTEEGMRFCRVAAAPLGELASASVGRTLRAAREPEPDLIVYSQDTPTGDQPAGTVTRLAAAAGLPATPVIAVGGNGCGNAGAGLRVACGLLRAEELAQVLFVTADCVTGETRYLPDDLAVLSDGAASCLISSELTAPGFRVLGIAASAKADLDRSAGGLLTTRAVVSGIRLASRRVFAAAGVTPGDCRHVLVGNYGDSMRGMLVNAVGASRGAMYTPLVVELGHCFAADILIGMETLLDSGELAKGDLLVGVTSGERSWTVLLLEYAIP